MSPTFFEAVTAMAIDYFHTNKTDVVIWETGLGGSYDSTNIVNSTVSAITNVGLDHCEYLGNTIAKIATDKAGIIKENSIFCTASNNRNVIEIFKKICADKNTKMVISGKNNLKFKKNSSRKFDYVNANIKFYGLTTGLSADYQRDNISLSIAIVYEFFKKAMPEICLTDIEKYIRNGLSKLKIQGRFQLLNSNPPIIADPAHNPAGFEALRKSILKKYPGWKYTFVFGMLSDKDYDRCARIIAPVAHRIYCVEPPSKRKLPAIELTQCCAKYASPSTGVFTGATLHEILNRYNTGNRQEKKLLVICGSFYLVGETLKLFKKTRIKIFDRETDYR